MAHEAPTTKEDALITLLTHCTELELQAVLEELAKDMKKRKILHVAHIAFDVDEGLVDELRDEIEELQEKLKEINSLSDI